MKSKDLDIIHVSAHSVRIMCATLLELGINPKPILEQTGISPDLIEDMDLEITGKQEIVCQRLFAEATKHIPGAWFKTGQKYRLLSYGNLGLAMLCANTVHDALKICISSFQDLNYSLLSYRLLEDGANVYGIETEDDDVPDDLKAFCQERSLGSVNTMFSDMLMQPFPFISIESALASRPIWLEADEIAGVPIIFGCAKSRWIFDVQLSERRLPMANPLLETMYERLCERLVTRMNNYTGLVGRVYAILVRSGREIPSFPVVASELALSERTLHRRLAQMGLSFRMLVAQVREQQAKSMLGSSDNTIAQIADHLGFTEISSFSHAFKRWTGMSPQDFRRASHVETSRPAD